jgi:hypothetical protein
MVYFFSVLAPSYRLRAGGSQATTAYFWWLAIAYGILFFSNNGVTPFDAAKSNDPRKQSVLWGADYNETHIAAALSGALLGLALRKRIARFSI